MEDFSLSGLIFTIILMFIGASPGGTGGGIKTVTSFIIFSKINHILKGKEDVIIFKKKINKSYIEKAITIFFLGISLIICSLFILSLTEVFSLKNLLFEVVSAFGTVGLSTGITPYFSDTGKIILSITMFFGRIGPLTVVWALTGEKKKVKIDYAEERIIVG